MTPDEVGNWTSLGIGVALIVLVTTSIFKLIDAWVTISNERRKENSELKVTNNLLREENDRLRAKLYGERPPRTESPTNPEP